MKAIKHDCIFELFSFLTLIVWMIYLNRMYKVWHSTLLGRDSTNLFTFEFLKLMWWSCFTIWLLWLFDEIFGYFYKVIQDYWILVVFLLLIWFSHFWPSKLMRWHLKVSCIKTSDNINSPDLFTQGSKVCSLRIMKLPDTFVINFFSDGLYL